MAKGNSVNFTIKRVQELEGDGKTQTIVWDDSTPGLGVRITPAGARSYVFQYRIGRQTPRMTIGSCDTWKLGDAREEARRLRRKVDRGEDPRKAKQEKRINADLGAVLVKKVFGEYLEAHEDKWSERHLADMKYHSRKDDGILWPLLKKRLSDINAHSLIKWAREALKQSSLSVHDKGRNAALIHGQKKMKSFWRWAYEREHYQRVMASPDIFGNSDLKKLIPQQKSKQDVLFRSQVPTWFKAVRGIESPVISTYLQILMLIGSRPGELRKLRWEDINFTWKTMHLHDKVDADGRTIPLTPYVEHLLERLDKQETGWIFPSKRSKTGYIENPGRAHRDATRAVEISGLTLHGFRRCFASFTEEARIPEGASAQIQGHKPSATRERHYKVRQMDTLREELTRYEQWLLDEAGVQFNMGAAGEGVQVVK